MNPGTYAFIYDDIVNDRRHERHIAELEARLTALDIQGSVGRLALFRSARDQIESMVQHGVTTVVIVGNDRSLDKMMWFLPDLPVTVGYIPIDEPSSVASLLGIPTDVSACDILAARYVETIDMGKCDDRYFLTEVSLPTTIASVDIEGRYRISAINGGSIVIRNLGNALIPGKAQADVKDGLLEVIVTPEPAKPRSRWSREEMQETRILIQHGEIVSPEPVDVRIDNHVANGFRFALSVVPKKLKFITGRQRRPASVEGLSNQIKTATMPAAMRGPGSALGGGRLLHRNKQ